MIPTSEQLYVPVPHFDNGFAGGYPLNNYYEDMEKVYELTQEAGGANATVLEVGVHTGRTALVMILAGATVHCVDNWGHEGAYGVFRGNCRDFLHSGRMIAHRGQSIDLAKEPLTGFPFDLIYIDADHSEQQAFADITAWLPHLKVGGIMSGHDINMEGVQAALARIGVRYNSVREHAAIPFDAGDEDHSKAGGVWWFYR